MSTRHRMAAWADLLRHYRDVFSYFWQQRHTRRTNFFNQQEAEFLPAALALQERPDSPTLRLTARVLMGIVLFTLLWSVVGKTDIVVNAAGKVIPSARTKTIASVDVASVRALHVSEGQQVQASQLLIELDSSSSDAEHDKAADSVAQASLQLARAQGMIRALKQSKPPHLEPVPAASAPQWQAAQLQLEGQYQDFLSKCRRLDAEIARFSSALPLATQRADDFKALLAHGDVSRHAWLEREQARIDLAGQLADARNQRAVLITQTLREAHDSLSEGSKILNASAQDRRRAAQHSKLLQLTAPVDGTVQQLSVHTVGGVVPAAQPLMQIVPKDSRVEVEAFLENRDVGFVLPGQTAAVKFDAYDYTKYGTIDAVVVNVSQDAIADEKRGLIYATKIALNQDHIMVDGKALPLSAGMSVSVEIKTGTRRVIEYVLSPLIQHQREALRER